MSQARGDRPAPGTVSTVSTAGMAETAGASGMAEPAGVAPAAASGPRIVRSAVARAEDPDAVAHLARALAGPEGDLAALDLVILYASPRADFDRLAAEARRRFAPAAVTGCTTAGELSGQGYDDGAIVAIGLPRSHFRTRLLAVPDLGGYDAAALRERAIRNRTEMTAETPDWRSEFACLLIDGLSLREDALTADLAAALGPVPLFGGSAGDGRDFARTRILLDGRGVSHAAVLVQVRSRCPVRVFNTDHYRPRGERMVVTGADPARRVVWEINAEPAAQEYARILGKDPQQLTTFTFAAHPVVVRIGGRHHVRSIRQVDDNGDLVFFSAIDEGVVLTLAEPRDMGDHLRAEMAALGQGPAAPDIVLACDCLLRRMEAEEKQKLRELSDILAHHRVVGFSTYGEQVNSMHVNQTLTGVAIYPPDPAPRGAAQSGATGSGPEGAAPGRAGDTGRAAP